MKTDLHFECSCFYCHKAKPLIATAFGFLCQECMKTIKTDLEESIAMVEESIAAIAKYKEV